MSNSVVTAIFFVIFTFYWGILSVLIDSILKAPKLKQIHWLIVGAFNATVLFCMGSVVSNVMIYYGVMLVLMIVEIYFFYKDSFGGALLCTLACGIHIIAVFMITLSVYSLVTGRAPYDILICKETFILWGSLSFLLLDGAIFTVLKIIPLAKVKLINQHKEQQWFIIAWMAVSNIFLIYMESLLHDPSYPSYLTVSQIMASVALLIGLYIVLFFSIITSSLLGYKDKTLELEQAIQKEQQYHDFMVRDTIVSYEINATKDLLIQGFKEYREKIGYTLNGYSDLLILLAKKFIYVDDIEMFIESCGRINILKVFESGEREFFVEYRQSVKVGEYIWVRAIINMLKDIETGDIRAFICIKNVDDEKVNQLELLRQAERDPLTGLYNRSTATRLIDEHIINCQSAAESALFMIDVDNFKEINDNLGHIFGDAVLCELADKLTHIFRSDDIVGRIGGDEFIVFLKDKATVQTAQIKASEVCKSFNVTYKGEGETAHTISSSIGISFFPNDGKSFKELYSHADVALYSAKSDGKNGFSLYNGSNFSAYASQRTEIQSVGNVLQKGFRENRVEYIFKMLYQSENPVSAIHSVLELVTRHFSFERGYIFETSKDGKTTSNTFEWCADGVNPEITNLQNLDIETVETANSQFRKTGTFILKSLDDLQPVERDVLTPQGIKSMFQFGIFDRNNLLGFIGFDNCTMEAVPSDTEIDELKTLCNLLSIFFVKQYVAESSEKDLRARQEVMNNLENYIYVINTETFELLFMNEKIQALLDDSEENHTCYSFFRGNPCQCNDCPLFTLAKEKTDKLVAEIYNNKLKIWMEIAASKMVWTDGSPACLICCTDITKQKEEYLEHVEQLEKLLYMDTLTGGLTYHKFLIDAQVILDKYPEKTYLIIKLDIANFKLINQIYGFKKGNEVLCCVSKAIEATMRNENEIFTRVNSDEFVVLLVIESYEEIETLNAVFLENFNRLIGDDFSFRCRFPHGRYVVKPEDNAKLDIHDMFEKVNIAHKTAKLSKTIEYIFYNEQMTKEALRVKKIENDMEAALINNEFMVYLQPKYYLQNETIGGAEALSRWNSPGSEFFLPAVFIPIFEQNGFIIKLDFYVFEKVCSVIKSWIDSGIEPVTVSVNFSRLHLGNATFVNSLCKIADRAGVPHNYLEIEITETVIFDNISILETLLTDIHESGFSMSMDDFGSGYSSLGMLKDFPVDVIKMDRSFFADQRDANRSKIVVGSIIQMAKSLDIRIVAEGVEEREHINFLRELNCDMVQGYYYAKPMSIDSFTNLLTDR